MRNMQSPRLPALSQETFTPEQRALAEAIRSCSWPGKRGQAWRPFQEREAGSPRLRPLASPC